MKKELLLLSSLLMLVGCSKPELSQESSSGEELSKASIIAPSGTPLLGIASYIKDHQEDFTLASGAQPLKVNLTSKSTDIVVAPVNLGSQVYLLNQAYGLYETFVWGNLFLATTESISSFTDLDGKDITIFGQGQTPDIIMKMLMGHYNITMNVTYVDAVGNANQMLMSGKASTIVSAEPSFTNVKKQKELTVLDLQEEYKKAFNVSSYPQAGIFIKLEKKDELKPHALKLKEAVLDAISNPSRCAEAAVQIDSSFATLGVDVLTEAIPNCHFGFSNNQRQDVETYFNNLNELGLSAQYGGSLPDEGFYLTY